MLLSVLLLLPKSEALKLSLHFKKGKKKRAINHLKFVLFCERRGPQGSLAHKKEKEKKKMKSRSSRLADPKFSEASGLVYLTR
jgi:hypothetical protein